jgi:hypothetical protein
VVAFEGLLNKMFLQVILLSLFYWSQESIISLMTNMGCTDELFDSGQGQEIFVFFSVQAGLGSTQLPRVFSWGKVAKA